jgi:peptidyl-prolyl cis-trans isomerase C
MAAHGYTEAQFRQSLGREMAAAWMREQIALGVPETADQAHARQILLYNSEQAEQVLALLQGGQDFADLAEDYDLVTGGDLGWFPQGYLFSSAVEEAAFNLQPGQYSGVIETPLGFHIVQLVERDPQHPLSSDARRALQLQAVSTWLAERRSQSDIAVLLP